MMDVNLMMKYFPKALNSICKIILDEGFSSGFFCKIPYTEDNNLLLPALITCNHALPLDAKYINEIKIILNGEIKTIIIRNRKKWTNIYMDYTVIEIKENEDNIHNFLILDDTVFKNNCSNECYLNQNVVIFALKRDDEQLAFSNGIIKKCYEYYFSYTSTTYKGCSGGCIINQNNGNVIGFHKGATKKGDNDGLKTGIFLIDVIKDIKEIKNRLLSNVNYINFNFNFYFIYRK